MKKAKALLLLVSILLIFVTMAIAQAVTCPMDGLNSLWTGRFKWQGSQTFDEYKCEKGHLFWVRHVPPPGQE